MTNFMRFARSHGLMPDWAWYQLNGASAQENWIEQREKIYADQEAAPQISFTSEVKLK